MLWFGREPAQLVAQVVSVITALVMLLPIDEGLSAAIVAVAIALGGFVVAAAVVKDGQLAAFTGLGRAGIALLVVLGLPWDDKYQALLLVAIEQIAALFIRDRVVAPVTADGANVRGDTLRPAA